MLPTTPVGDIETVIITFSPTTLLLQMHSHPCVTTPKHTTSISLFPKLFYKTKNTLHPYLNWDLVWCVASSWEDLITRDRFTVLGAEEHGLRAEAGCFLVANHNCLIGDPVDGQGGELLQLAFCEGIADQIEKRGTVCC